MNFIKQIFLKKTDESTNNQFVRFSKGTFERAFVYIKNSKDLKIKTSFEFANDFVRIIAENTNEILDVSGKIFYKGESKKFSVLEINEEMNSDKLKELYEKYKKDNMLLKIKGKDFNLKINQTLHNPRGKFKEDFCSGTFSGDIAKFILEEFAFDFQDFKEAKIKHIIDVTNIEIPEEYKNDFLKARLYGRRKGKIKRIIEIDGKIKEKEISF